MKRLAASLAVVALLGLAFQTSRGLPLRSDTAKAAGPNSPEEIRRLLFADVQPIKLANCELERFGEKNDGGYLLCGNLLREVRAGYSYGINGFDGWGCDVSKRLGIRVHQYDCFNTQAPICPRGDTVFHAACVADSFRVEEGRPFDTIAAQMRANGDGGKRVVLKIDVEGAEWESLLKTPDEVLQRIDQMAVEFHKVEDEKFVQVLGRLKTHFHVAHLHFNNWSCAPNLKPFPAWAYEVLFVSKRLGVPASPGTGVGLTPVDAPNNPNAPDCQS